MGTVTVDPAVLPLKVSSTEIVGVACVAPTLNPMIPNAARQAPANNPLDLITSITCFPFSYLVRNINFLIRNILKQRPAQKTRASCACFTSLSRAI
jgi:hypothetical protein